MRALRWMIVVALLMHSRGVADSAAAVDRGAAADHDAGHDGLARWRHDPAAIHAGGTRDLARHPMERRSGRHRQLRADLPRCRCAGEQLHRRHAALDGLEHSGDRYRLAQDLPDGFELPNGTRQISVSGSRYRGPGAPAAGPIHHYVMELYALDTMLDIKVAPQGHQDPNPNAASHPHLRSCRQWWATSAERQPTSGCSTGS